MPLPLRLALRELRGGLAGFRVFLACLALGVAAIAAVGSVRAAIEHGLTREAAALLGGDAEIEFTYRFADPDERAWMDDHATAVSEIVDFRSLVAVPRPEGEAERTLVQVKAVDSLYPLVGTVRLAGGGGLADALAPRDGLPGIVAEKVLVDRLGLVPGDEVRLGTTAFRLADTLVSEPDAIAGGVSFGPRVIVRHADLDDKRPARAGLAVRFVLPAAAARRGRPRRPARRRDRPLRRLRVCNGATVARDRRGWAASSTGWGRS